MSDAHGFLNPDELWLFYTDIERAVYDRPLLDRAEGKVPDPSTENLCEQDRRQFLEWRAAQVEQSRAMSAFSHSLAESLRRQIEAQEFPGGRDDPERVVRNAPIAIRLTPVALPARDRPDQRAVPGGGGEGQQVVARD